MSLVVTIEQLVTRANQCGTASFENFKKADSPVASGESRLTLVAMGGFQLVAASVLLAGAALAGRLPEPPEEENSE